MHFTGIDVIRSGTDIPVANPIAAEQNVELTYGDTLRVNISLEYRGSAQTVTLYGAIGVRAPLSFEEKVFGEATLQLPNSPTSFSPVSGSVDIPITADISPGTDYDPCWNPSVHRITWPRRVLRILQHGRLAPSREANLEHVPPHVVLTR